MIRAAWFRAGWSFPRVCPPSVPLRYSNYYSVLYAITHNTFQSHYGPRASSGEGGRDGGKAPHRAESDWTPSTETVIISNDRHTKYYWCSCVRLCITPSRDDQVNFVFIETNVLLSIACNRFVSRVRWRLTSFCCCCCQLTR